MEEKRKYFIFNKPSDYRRGYLHQMTADTLGIGAQEAVRGRAVFISGVLDSREPEMMWHRRELKGNETGGAVFRLSVYTSNEPDFIYEKQKTEWADFISRGDISVEEKLRCMAPCLKKQADNADDMLLHEVKGRYLWLVIEMYRQQKEIRLRDIRLSFPGQSWMQYLPEIYQQEDYGGMFLQRYLGIFQTLYEDMGEKIRRSASLFDMETTERKFLDWLAQWLAIDESYIWSEQQLRCLLAEGITLYKRRGTRQGIMDFVALYTGEEPFVLENHQLQYFRSDRERLDRLQKLYGSNPYSFVVLVREQVLPSLQKQRTLHRIIEAVKPVQTEFHLIILKPYLFLGGHSYLGINSVLGRYTDMVLDGHSALSFTTLGSNRNGG